MILKRLQRTMAICSTGRKGTKKERVKDMIGCKIMKHCRQSLKNNYKGRKMQKY